MSTVLTNGIIIPDNGNRNWGGDLANNWNIIDVNIGYMTDVKNRITTLENSVAENSSNIEINASNISALQTSKQDTIEDLETIRSGASAGATAVQPSALNNYVDLSSGQTIDGSKVFTNDVRIIKNSPFCYLFSNDYIKGETPTSNVYQGIRFFDDPTSSSANHITGGFEITYDTSGYTIASINARTYANNRQLWKSINFRIANDDTRSIDFYPNSDSEINLGTSSNKWKDVYATAFHGNLVGNANTATNATNNASGNELSNDIIKGLSVSGKTITYTKLDGSTGTITTQDTNTDTKVTNTLGNTTKAYITGTTSATTNTGTQIFDSGVYLTTTAGQLHADIDFPITEAQVNEILGIS